MRQLKQKTSITMNDEPGNSKFLDMRRLSLGAKYQRHDFDNHPRTGISQFGNQIIAFFGGTEGIMPPEEILNIADVRREETWKEPKSKSGRIQSLRIIMKTSFFSRCGVATKQ